MAALRDFFTKISFICLFLPLPLIGFYHNIEKIPLEDRQKLERLFDYLIHCSEFGYTLCGEKPVSIEATYLLNKIRPEHFVITFNNCRGYSILIRGGEAWNRCSYLFPSKNFVFRYIPEFNRVALINKKATERTIEENLDLFQKYSHSKQTAIEFLNDVCFPKDKNKEYLGYYNEILLGILLGYGRNNAIAFSNKNGLIQQLEGFIPENFIYGISAFIPPGLMIINNGTNEEENNKIRKMFKTAKANMLENFKKGSCFDNFMRLYCDHEQK
jgi:hypothetical protein